jgi:LysM repeat protein
MVAKAEPRTPPTWWQGIKRPPTSYAHDLPQAWPIEVRRGETLALLATWAGSEAETIREDNRPVLRRRRWLKVGDRLMLTMSANQKLTFEHSRERFQQERLDAYFTKRFIEKVVVYVVKRGDVIALVARDYGEVPTWLLEAFNQTDFRYLQPGDEVLIPVVRDLLAGEVRPPALQVIDGSGLPLTADKRTVVEKRMDPALLSRARMAVDDASVFERDQAQGGRRGLLPRVSHLLRRQDVSRDDAPVRALVALPAPSAPVTPREVIIRRGETLSHYGAWANLSVAAILAANPGLDSHRIRAGDRIKLPLDDDSWAAFFVARAQRSNGSSKTRALAAAGGAVSVDKKPTSDGPRFVPAVIRRQAAEKAAPAPRDAEPRYYRVRRGDVAGQIAQKHGLTLSRLMALNDGQNIERIQVGQSLRIR